MPIEYPNLELLHVEDFRDFTSWHHEGIGQIEPAPEGGMQLHCLGSRQGAQGSMAFFRPTLPDQIALEYEITVLSHGGLVINYIAIRGLNGEDMIEDRDRMEPRTGIMANYYARRWGLQSYHVSFSRFNDRGEHTATSNWRRNPGCLLIGHGTDLCQELRRTYHIRLLKDGGHCQFFVDGRFAHGFIDRDTTRYPIPDCGKFGFRLIGSDVKADVRKFRVYKIARNESVWRNNE